MDPRYLPRFRLVTVAAPAVATDHVIRPDTSGGWLIRSAVATLVTDVNAANREVILTAENDGAVFFRSAAGVVQAASLTRVYGAYNGGAGAASVGGTIGIGLPTEGLWLPQGHTLRTATASIQVGDQWSSMILAVDEFPSGSPVTYRPLSTFIVEESS